VLKELLQTAIEKLAGEDIKVYDVCILKVDYKNVDAMTSRIVGVWEFSKELGKNILIMDNEHPLRRVAEVMGCDAVQLKWGEVDVIVEEEHPMFHLKEDIAECLSNVEESTSLMLKSEGRYYFQDDGVLFGIDKTWVKLPGDFSQKKTMFAEKGTFWMHPSPMDGRFKGRYNLTVWSASEEDMIYNQHLFLRDIKTMDDAEVVAILL
jgi:hypothetical protein